MKELSRVFEKNRKLVEVTNSRTHFKEYTKVFKKSMIIPKLMYLVMLTHSAVNVHVNTGANGNPIKAVRRCDNPSL